VRTARTVATGTGLTGGGTLAADRTLAFDAAWGDARYAEHVSSGFSNTISYDDLFGVSGNGAATFGHSGAARPSDAPVTGQAGGIHIGNTWGRTQLVFPNAANRVFFRNGTQTAWAELWHSGNLTPSELTPNTRSITAGTGLLGGGDLTADRVISFDAAWGDARYALRTRQIATGDGLAGGGDLSLNRTFSLSGQALALHNLANNGLFARTGAGSVAARTITQGSGVTVTNGDGVAGNPVVALDATVLRTTGDQSVAGVKGFTASPTVPTPVANADAVNKGYVDGAIAGLTTNLSARRVDAGTGLVGGGDLSADRVISFDTTWGDTRYALRARQIVTGAGLTGGGDLSANRTLTFDAAWGDARYAEHLTSGFSTTVTYDDVLGVVGNGAASFAHGGAVRPSDSPVTGMVSGLHLGNSAGRAQVLFPNAANRIFFRNGTQTAWAELWHSGNLNVTELTPITRAINAGTGLSGGGTLSIDRTLSFDTAWGDARYALAARNMTAGDGLTGGGTLAADRTFSVDASVVRTSGAQTIGGAKTFSASPNFSNLRVLGVATPTQGTDAANKAYVDAAIGSAAYTAGTGLDLSGSTFALTDVAAGSATVGAVRYNGVTAAAGRFYGGTTAPTNTTRLNYDGALYATQLFDGGVRVVSQSRTLTAGDGLTGGGTLAADRTFSVDATVVRTTRSVSTGTGLTGGGDLTANRTLAFDATWGDARYATLSTAQTISGAKTFTASPNFSNLRVLGVATPTQGTDAANKAYVDAAVSASAGTTYTAGTGLTLTGTTFALADNQIRRDALTTSAGVVAYNGHTAANAQFYGGTTNPTSTNTAHRVNFQGSIYATRFYATQYFYFSDETLKENVERIGGAEGMDLIREIRPVRYDWKETGREALGVIAQETARVLPNLVDTDPNGIMSVDYIQLIAPLIAAVQELDARVTALEARSAP